VIGLPDEDYGQRLAAFAVPHPDTEIEETSIREYLNDRVSRFEQPRDIKIVQTIPRNPAGKAVRSELKTWQGVSPWRPLSAELSPSAGGFDSEGHRSRLARVLRIRTFGAACDDVNVVGEGNVRTSGTFAGDAAEAVEIVDIDCLGDGLLTPDLEEAAGSSRPRLCLDDHRPLQLRA
jgi:hypothetical protein